MALAKSTALRVNSSTESKVRTLAAKISKRFSWQVEGPRVLQIIDWLLDDLSTQPGRKPSKAAVLEYVSGVVVDLDKTLGWDSPNMGDEAEDQLLGWMVQRRVEQRW